MRPVEPLLIFDLDGTILRRNSFPVWAVAMLRLRGHGTGLRPRARLSLAVLRLLLARKLGRLDHDHLMHALQVLWGQATARPGTTLAADLQARLVRMVRPNLEPILRFVADDTMDGLLATAAAADYADALGRHLGFSDIIATAAGRAAADPLNTGTHKRDRVVALLQEKGWAERPRIFFNDDMADLPLMLECNAVCWFGSRRALRQAMAAAPAVRFLPCRSMRPDEMATTIAHLGQSLAAAHLSRVAPDLSGARSRVRTWL